MGERHGPVREQEPDTTQRFTNQRFRGGLVFKALILCVSLNSRLESNKEEREKLTKSTRWTTNVSGPPHLGGGATNFAPHRALTFIVSVGAVVTSGGREKGGGWRVGVSDRQRKPKSHMTSLNESQSRDIASLLPGLGVLFLLRYYSRAQS